MLISWVRRFRGVGLLLEEPMLAREEVRDMGEVCVGGGGRFGLGQGGLVGCLATCGVAQVSACYTGMYSSL